MFSTVPKTFSCLALCLVLVVAAAPAALAAPVFDQLSPAAGTVLPIGAGQLVGSVSDAVELRIDGGVVPLAGDGTFTFAYDLPEGGSTLQLWAIDAQGVETGPITHPLVVDTLAPSLDLDAPLAGVHLASGDVTVTGGLQEPHLTSLVVEASTGASLSPTPTSGSWTAAFTGLPDGVVTFEAVARDVFGRETRRSVEVVVDSVAPSVAVREAGQPFAGGLVARPLTLDVEVSDAVALEQVSFTLDGVAWSSGTTIDTEGPHTLLVTATDAAGNLAQTQLDFTIDLTPPTIVAVQPASGSLLATTPATLTIDTAGDATQVLVGGVAAQAAGAGTFTIDRALVEGTQSFPIVAVDAAGLQSERLHALILDATPPLLGIDAPSDGDAVATATVTVRGTAEDERLAEVRVDGILATRVGTTWQVDAVPIVEGANALVATARDTLGNETTAQVMVTRDSAAPTFRVLVDGLDLVSGASFSAPISPILQIDDPQATVDATLDGAPFTSGTEVAGDGVHELAVTVTDTAGLSSSQLLVFTIDRQAPTITELAPVDGSVQAAAEVTLVGLVGDAVEVTVDGQPATVVGGGFRAGPLSLAEGQKTFQIVARGANGLETTVSHRVVRDATAPTLQVTRPIDASLLGERSVQVTGFADDAHLESVRVRGVEAALSASAFATDVALDEGSNLLQIVARDVVGHETTATRTVRVDTLDPTITITNPAPGSIVPDATLTVRGSVEDPNLDRVEVAGVRAVVDGGTWSADVPLADGLNTLEAVAIDQLGHRATASVGVTRDSQAPQVSISLPSDGVFLPDDAIEVRGSVDDEVGVTVTVNGQAALVEQGVWTAAAVALNEGENRLVARASDAQGNEGVHSIFVHRDTQAPRFLTSSPASGALAVPVESVVRLTFDEPLGDLSAGALRLETAAGAPIAATTERQGELVVVTPDAALPPETDLRLVLTAALVDRAGNALVDVPAPIELRTVDTGAPSAPTLAFPAPDRLCGATLVLQGSTEADVVVRATGGAAVAETRAADDGTYLLEVELLADRPNRLEVVAVDAIGNASAPTIVDTVHDCTSPTVVSATWDGALDVTIVFSEAIDPATLAAAVALIDTSGALAATTAVDGGDPSGATVGATLAATPSGALALEVSTAARDLAGNALAYPFRLAFGNAAADSFVSGTAIDDATGRPLDGVVVQIVATDGVALGEPLPRQTVGPDGRFLVPIGAGTHDLTFARPDFVPVFRVVTTQAGDGTSVFHPRLVPLTEAESLGAAGGSLLGGAAEVDIAAERPQLDLPAGALAGATAISLTALSEQGLPALLPYGWSPRGAVWLEADGALSASATLRLPVTAPNGTILPVVALDLTTLGWTVLDLATVADGAVTVSVADWGAIAAVEADVGATAPPAAAVGQPLGSSAAPVGDEVTGAALSFSPATVMATQRSRATVDYVFGAAPAPSGTPLSLRVQEELELLDGSLRREAPYRADVVLYRDAAGQPSSRFWIAPSEAARSSTFREGVEDVTVRSYGDETVRGNVLGPDGGAVVSTDGDTLTLPAGALDGPAAVRLARGAVADLPIGVPTAGTAIEVLTLDLGGRRLAAPARLDIATPSAPAAGARGLLLHVASVPDANGLSSTRWHAVADLEPSASGWATRAIDALDLPWPGVREEGTYLALELSTAPAFVRGTVTKNGVALAGAVVEGSLAGVDDPEWLAITDALGRYVLPVEPTATAREVRARDARGDARGVSVVVDAADARFDLNILIEPLVPYVIEVSPINGTAGVPLGVEPTLRFSETIDPASLEGNVELRAVGVDGTTTAIPVTFDLQGALLRLMPLQALDLGAEYRLWAGNGVRDLQGYGLAAPVETSFATVEEPDIVGLDPSRIELEAPDFAGMARVVGLAGAVPAGSLVTVENQTAFSTQESVAAAADGSFTLTLAASLGDRVALTALIDGQSSEWLPLGPWVSADRRAVWTPTTEDAVVVFTTSEGIEVTIAPGTFDRDAWARVETVAPADVPLDRDPRVATAGALRIDVGEAVMRQPLGLRLPIAASDVVPTATYVLSRLVEIHDTRGWMVFDSPTLEVQGDGSGILQTKEPTISAAAAAAASTKARRPELPVPDAIRTLDAEEMQRRLQGELSFRATPPVRPAPIEGGAASALRAARSAEVTRPTADLKLYVPFLGVVMPGLYTLTYVTEPFVFATLGAFAHGYTVYNASFVPPYIASYSLAPLGAEALVVPYVADEVWDLTVIDDNTGLEVAEGQHDGQAGVPLDPALFDDQAPPAIRQFEPFSVSIGRLPAEGSLEIAAGATATLPDTRLLTVVGAAGTTHPDVWVTLVDMATGRFVVEQSDGAGGFLLTLDDVEPGSRVALAYGDTLAASHEPWLRFSERVVAPESILSVSTREPGATAWRPVAVEFTTFDAGQGFRFAPAAGWAKGDYRVRLQPEDLAGNVEASPIYVHFEVLGGAELGDLETPFLDDTVRFGGLLYAAARQDGVRIYDVSAPRAPR
ncbi:MAG: Ig-like domain-containing protein, partial [Acidobacteriota bacterium]